MPPSSLFLPQLSHEAHQPIGADPRLQRILSESIR